MNYREKYSDAARAYTYTLRDVFGELIFYSKAKLEGEALDQLTTAVLASRSPQGEIGDVTFVFTPANPIDERPDLFSIVPDLKEGTTIETLITALVASLSLSQLARFRAHLEELDAIRK